MASDLLVAFTVRLYTYERAAVPFSEGRFPINLESFVHREILQKDSVQNSFCVRAWFTVRSESFSCPLC